MAGCQAGAFRTGLTMPGPPDDSGATAGAYHEQQGRLQDLTGVWAPRVPTGPAPQASGNGAVSQNGQAEKGRSPSGALAWITVQMAVSMSRFCPLTLLSAEVWGEDCEEVASDLAWKEGRQGRKVPHEGGGGPAPRRTLTHSPLPRPSPTAPIPALLAKPLRELAASLPLSCPLTRELTPVGRPPHSRQALRCHVTSSLLLD